MAGAAPARIANAVAITGAGDTGEQQLGDLGHDLNVMIEVAALTGNIQFNVEWSPDGGTTWYTDDPSSPAPSSAMSSAGNIAHQWPIKAPTYKIAWSGTVSAATVSIWTYVTGYP